MSNAQICIEDFKSRLLSWVNKYSEIEGVAVIGSYARGEQQPASDIDVIIFCPDPTNFVDVHSWLKNFGDAKNIVTEQWGVVQTVRAFFDSGSEVEFNFCTLTWSDIPVDHGTYKVVTGGFDIVYDPTGKLTNLQSEVSKISGFSA